MNISVRSSIRNSNDFANQSTRLSPFITDKSLMYRKLSSRAYDPRGSQNSTSVIATAKSRTSVSSPAVVRDLDQATVAPGPGRLELAMHALIAACAVLLAVAVVLDRSLSDVPMTSDPRVLALAGLGFFVLITLRLLFTAWRLSTPTLPER